MAILLLMIRVSAPHKKDGEEEKNKEKNYNDDFTCYTIVGGAAV